MYHSKVEMRNKKVTEKEEEDKIVGGEVQWSRPYAREPAGSIRSPSYLCHVPTW